jgi:ribonuclease P protein component
MPLAKQQRIRSASAISDIMKTMRPILYKGFAIRVKRMLTQRTTTFAIIIPLSVAPKAVQRNAIRRQVAASVQYVLAKRAVSPDAAVVITIRDPASAIYARDVLLSLFEKSGILLK